MNLLADENIEQQMVQRLRQDGHTVLYVSEMEPSITDDLVLQRANEHQALLLTGDKDFGELVFRQGLVHLGVALVRLESLPPETKAELVSQVFTSHAAEMENAFSVISPGRLRIRSRLSP
ncbi:MAG: DUF5615 family PIN-like protein [Actinomycetota bacterium]